MEFTEQKLYAGASWEWTESLSEYPASDGWTLTLYLKHKTDPATTILSTADGDNFKFSLTADETKAFAKTDYLYQFVAVNSGEVDIVEEGEVQIGVLLNAADDTRSDNEIILDAIIAALKGRATREQEEIEFAGRKIKYLSLEELIEAKKYFESEVKKELRVKLGKSGTPRILEKY